MMGQLMEDALASVLQEVNQVEVVPSKKKAKKADS